EAVAVIEGDRRWTYAELDRWSNAVAHQLSELAPGSLVGIPGIRSAAFVATILGVLKAGSAYVPLALDEPEERQAQRRADCALVLTSFPAFTEREPQIDADETQIADLPISPICENLRPSAAK